MKLRSNKKGRQVQNLSPSWFAPTTWGYRRSRVVSVDAPWMKIALRQFHEVYWSFNLIIMGWISYVCFGMFWSYVCSWTFHMITMLHLVHPVWSWLAICGWLPWWPSTRGAEEWATTLLRRGRNQDTAVGDVSKWCEQVMWHRRIYIEWSFNNLQEFIRRLMK